MSVLEQRACKEVGALLVFYICSETSEQENHKIEKHLAQCADCASQLAEEKSLHESLMDALQLTEESDQGGILLSQCRSELAEVLDDLSAPPVEQPWRPFGWLRQWMVLRPVLSGACLVVVGVAIGTEMLPRILERFDATVGVPTVTVSPTAQLTDEQLAKMAVAGVTWTPPVDGAAGNVRLQVRTEEPMVLTGSVDDPDVRRVLTYVVENGERTDAGVKLDCLDALRLHTSDVDVRRALLHAARKDQNPAVRMKALDSLRDAATDPAVRATLIEALEQDANSGVRVEAVNLLVHSMGADALRASAGSEPALPPIIEPPVDPSLERVVRTLRELERKDPNPNVRLRSAAALRQIGPREIQ